MMGFVRLLSIIPGVGGGVGGDVSDISVDKTTKSHKELYHLRYVPSAIIVHICFTCFSDTNLKALVQHLENTPR